MKEAQMREKKHNIISTGHVRAFWPGLKEWWENEPTEQELAELRKGWTKELEEYYSKWWHRFG